MNRFVKSLTWLALCALGGFIVWQWWSSRMPPLDAASNLDSGVVRETHAPPTAPTDSIDASASAPPSAIPPMSTGISHPVEVVAPTAPLPSLDDSDAAVLMALSPHADPALLAQYFELTGVVRKLVVTVDNLAGGKVALKNRLATPIAGKLLVHRSGGFDENPVLSSDNYARYLGFVAAVTVVDPAAAATLYRYFYPLFQQAYVELGYPDGYFNDRLVAVLDHLVAAPDITKPIALVQPKVLYLYADPALEDGSPGRKILLRIGPANAARIKTWLQRFRALIALSKN